MKRIVLLIFVTWCYIDCCGQCFDSFFVKDFALCNDSEVVDIQLIVTPLFLSEALSIDEIVDSLKINKPYSALNFKYSDTTFYAPIDYLCEKKKETLLKHSLDRGKPILITLRIYKKIHVYYCPENNFVIIIDIAKKR